MAKSFIFDMDGTLLHSMIYWYNSGARICVKYFDDPKIAEQLSKMSARELVIYAKQTLSEEQTKNFRKEWHQAMLDHYMNDITMVEGVVEFLEKAKKAGIRMGIATGTPEYMSVPALQKFGLLDYFEFVISEDTIGKGKSEPDIYVAAANKLGAKIEDCVVFEDGLHGAKSAKKLGMKLVGIYDEIGKVYEQELRDLADLYIYNFENLEPTQL